MIDDLRSSGELTSILKEADSGVDFNDLSETAAETNSLVNINKNINNNINNNNNKSSTIGKSSSVTKIQIDKIDSKKPRVLIKEEGINNLNFFLIGSDDVL